MEHEAHESSVSFRGHRVWYRRVGATAPGKLPLLYLHGGPSLLPRDERSMQGLDAFVSAIEDMGKPL